MIDTLSNTANTDISDALDTIYRDIIILLDRIIQQMEVIS